MYERGRGLAGVFRYPTTPIWLWPFSVPAIEGELLFADVEQIADPVERPDPTLLARRGAELPPNTADPNSQIGEVVSIFRAPHLGQQFGMQDDLARVVGKVLKKQPFRSGELHKLAAPRQYPPLQVDLDVVERDQTLARL